MLTYGLRSAKTQLPFSSSLFEAVTAVLYREPKCSRAAHCNVCLKDYEFVIFRDLNPVKSIIIHMLQQICLMHHRL